MPKPIVSIKVTPGQAKKLADAVDLVRTQYAPVLANWRKLTEAQRQTVLSHSPLLKRLLEGVA